MSFELYKNAWLFSGPENEEPRLNITECKELLKKGGYLVRNTYDFDCPGETSFWNVIKDSFGGMEELSSKMRNQVRRSMANYDFRRISREELLDQGYHVLKAAAEGYKVHSELPSKDEFRKQLLSEEKRDYWGVFDKTDGHLSAFAKNIVYEHSCVYSMMKALPAELSRYPYYGLIYTMNQYYLQELRMDYVNDGARSITEHSNIQPFLIQKFNFRKAYCRLNVVYKPWLALIVKVLYPVRRLVTVTTVRYLLYQEEMARSQMCEQKNENLY